MTKKVKVRHKSKPTLKLPVKVPEATPAPEAPSEPAGHYEFWRGTRPLKWYESWRLTKDGEYHFHVKAANGEIVAVSESYARKDDCLRAIAILQGSAGFEVKDITGHE